MFFVDLKETKVNLVTAAVFAAFPTGSVQSTHLTQTVVFYLNLNANTNTNTNTNVNTNTNTNTNTNVITNTNIFVLPEGGKQSPLTGHSTESGPWDREREIEYKVEKI